MFRDLLVLDGVFLLHMGKGLISAVSLSVGVHPKPYEVFSVTELATILGKFLVFLWGLGAQVLDIIDFLSISPHFCVTFYGMFIH